jgi:UDP-3-O-[3-hydroxymyristoyl] glucosamine N-acyltransferase
MADSRFFKEPNPLTLAQICEYTKTTMPNGKDPKASFKGVAGLSVAGPSDVSHFHNAKYLEGLKTTKAGVCFITEEYADQIPSSTIALVTKHPYRCFGQIASVLYPNIQVFNSISEHAFIHPKANIGKDCIISPFAVIEENVVIGNNCYIGSHTVIKSGSILGERCFVEPHVTISHALIGNQVYVKPGARIGQPGFGFHMDALGHFDIPQLGLVIIGNNVHIGANTTIDRGSVANTKIGNGVRIDNLVQIAHNVEIGDNSVLVAQVGIAGSTKLGNFVIAAGQVGIAGHLNIGDGVKIAAQSGLMRDVEKGETIAGSPAIPVRDWHKQTIVLQQLVKGKKHA